MANFEFNAFVFGVLVFLGAVLNKIISIKASRYKLGEHP